MLELSNGKYRAKAKSWALAESSKGTPEVAVEFGFSGDGAPTETITWHGYLSEATYERTIQSLRYCGWTGIDLDNLAGLDTNEVELVIENEEYEGSTYPKVQWVNRVGGLAVKAPMSPEKAKSFAALMREKIKAVDAAGGKRTAKSNGSAQRPPPAGPPEPPAITDEDLPF